MRLKVFMIRVNLTATGIFDSQRGQGADHDNSFATYVLWAELGDFAYIHYAQSI
ncbi:unannotated protein [freshwater metagenome]|uniref:Unannotated protein n=1 Tax=freshwater metagenome TaxID=449393 RepID=A0A6J7RZZ1_9ZZZZ